MRAERNMQINGNWILCGEEYDPAEAGQIRMDTETPVTEEPPAPAEEKPEAETKPVRRGRKR